MLVITLRTCIKECIRMTSRMLADTAIKGKFLCELSNTCDVTYLYFSRYKHSATRRYHERVHTGETPFECKVCLRKFRSGTALSGHSVIHEDRFVCRFCNKRFHDKTNLKYHERRHTGELPHGCHVCEKRFGNRHNRRKHVKAIHGEAEVGNIPPSDAEDGT